MSERARILATYASSLSFDDIPADVVHRAKQCVIDTIAAATYGAALPWSRMIAAHASRSGPSGRCRIFGTAQQPVQATAAALANGASAHAFELDSLRRPGAGVHPGASLVPPVLAMAQELGSSGRDVITAVVAGCEVLFRIGVASRHSSEKRGFHAPGLTGPFGAAVAVGRLIGLDEERMANALGIAGSLAGGLLEFASSRSGGMVKRLHLGRAAESGVVAACLARDGFTGPASVLEGTFGYLHVFCAEHDAERLTAGLGDKWETRNICFKRYPCHITAHTPIEAATRLRAEAGFAAEDIASVLVQGSAKMAELHNIPAPSDLIMAQYSIPWCVAAALLRDPSDPASFGIEAYHDPAVAALSRRISVVGSAPPRLSNWGSIVSIRLHDGQTLEKEVDDFPGTPNCPLTDEQAKLKFVSLTGRREESEHEFARLMHLETSEHVDWIGAQ